MGEKPSSRKRHRWSLEPGDLVRVINPRPPLESSAHPIGMVLSIYSANVYEGSSADILVGRRKLWIETKYLIRIDPDSDISVIS